jgi:low affinity Fe/Cu permease
MQQTLRRLASWANTALSPTTSAVLVIASVLWVLIRPLLHLSGALAAVVDTATTVTVLLAAILIEAGRQPPMGGTDVDPRSSGGAPLA